MEAQVNFGGPVSSGDVCDQCQQQRRPSMCSSLAPEQQLLCSASSEQLVHSCTIGCASCSLCLICILLAEWISPLGFFCRDSPESQCAAIKAASKMEGSMLADLSA